jgi:hypothetical protein
MIPPGPGSVLDKNTNTYIPGSEDGKVAVDGSYIPPQNVEITDDGKILVAVKDSTGAVIVKEMSPPNPVLSQSSSSIGSVATTIAANPSAPFNPPKNVEMNPDLLPRPGQMPSGGVQGITDPSTVLSNSRYTGTTITVRP